MESLEKSYFIEIPKDDFSYGFELKDEGNPYKKFASVLKITNKIASKQGLKVGDKIIRINGVKVSGKDYIGLRNNIRTSMNNCVKLEILNSQEPILFSPEPLSISNKRMAWEFTKKILVPVGSIREKIRFFQSDEKTISDAKIFKQSRSNSCGCLPESFDFMKQPKFINQISFNSLSSIANITKDDKSLNNDSLNEIIQPVSQEPFFDDSILASCGVIEVPVLYNNDRVLSNRSDVNIKECNLISKDRIIESMPEPFENITILSPSIPKIEISNFNSNPSISTSAISSKLIPGFSENISRSSNNLYDDMSLGWQNDLQIGNQSEFSSMTNINSKNKKDLFQEKKIHNYFRFSKWYHSEKKLVKQISILESIPIKLRIVQFKDKVRSKSWKDYILERTESGARFRKRIKSLRYDKTNDFVIKAEEVNRFAVESPHKRIKTGPTLECQMSDSGVTKYELMTVDSHVHLKFFFNSSIFGDALSSSQAHATYNDIISVFKRDLHKELPHEKDSLPDLNNHTIHISHSHQNFTTMKDVKNSNDDHEFSGCDSKHSPSTSNSFKCVSKSSSENISNTIEMTLPASKSIFKQAIDKIKPEKKVKSYEVFTGTKAELEEFKKQLERGILPMELDSCDETGTNFNKFIYEVPRMINHPKIPMIIYLCTKIVEKIGLQTEGIYRISGNQRVIKTLSSTLNKPLDEIETSLDEWNNVHAVCGTLKLFLRKLKQNLIPADLSHVLAYSCKAVDCDDPVSLSKTLMDIRYHLSSYQNSFRRKLEQSVTTNIDDQLNCRWQSLQFLLKHLSHVVSYRHLNSMDEHALSVCFNPVVMESWQKNISDIKADNEIMIKALELILIHQDWLFIDWNSNIGGSRSTELMTNAIKYATKYIENKYDISIKENLPAQIVDTDININKIVYKIVHHATTNFGERKRLERRHSSHMPMEKPCFLTNAVICRERHFLSRNSKVADALDLSVYLNMLHETNKVPKIEENQKIRVTYISSTKSVNLNNEKCDAESNVEQATESEKTILNNHSLFSINDRHKKDEYPNRLENLMMNRF